MQSSIPTILFIVGSDRSGSTILDLAMGTNSSCFSIGEIAHLKKEIQGKKWCTCGKKYYECSFWKKVNQDLIAMNINIFNNFSLALQYPKYSNNSIIRKFKHLVGLFGWETKTKQMINDYQCVYGTIFKNINGNIIVDSSKDILRAIALYRNIGYNCKIIHLVRDVRGVAYSGKKKKITACLPPDYCKKEYPASNPRSVKETTLLWKQQNNMIILLLRTLVKNNAQLLVRYEDLIQFPEATLKNICTWANINYSAQMIDFGTVQHHNVCGNASRFNSKRINNLSEKWKTELSEDEKEYCLKNAHSLLQRFSYIKKNHS